MISQDPGNKWHTAFVLCLAVLAIIMLIASMNGDLNP